MYAMYPIRSYLGRHWGATIIHVQYTQYTRNVTRKDIQSGASYLSLGFEDSVLGSSSG